MHYAALDAWVPVKVGALQIAALPNPPLADGGSFRGLRSPADLVPATSADMCEKCTQRRALKLLLLKCMLYSTHLHRTRF